MQVAETIFWSCTASVVFAYAIYPPVIYICSRLFGRAPSAPELSDTDLPSISLLIAAHNEDAVIEERIHNALAMDYPREKLQIVIASDRGDDGIQLRQVPLSGGPARAVTAATTPG